MVPVISFDGAFPHAPSARVVLLGLLPLGVLHPDLDVPSRAADLVLELLAATEPVVGELSGVGDFLLGRTDLSLLPLSSFP